MRRAIIFYLHVAKEMKKEASQKFKELMENLYLLILLGCNITLKS